MSRRPLLWRIRFQAASQAARILPPRPGRFHRSPPACRRLPRSTGGAVWRVLIASACRVTVLRATPTATRTRWGFSGPARGGAPGAIRTHTWQILGPLPLTFGLQGPCPSLGSWRHQAPSDGALRRNLGVLTGRSIGAQPSCDQHSSPCADHTRGRALCVLDAAGSSR